MSPEWIFLSSWSGLSFPITLCWEALSPKGEAVLAARMLCSNARGQGASDHLSQGGGRRGRLLNMDTKVNSDYLLESVYEPCGWALLHRIDSPLKSVLPLSLGWVILEKNLEMENSVHCLRLLQGWILVVPIKQTPTPWVGSPLCHFPLCDRDQVT